MVCFNQKQRGGFELHARSLNPSTFLQYHNWTGPGDDVKAKTDVNGNPLPQYNYINSLDKTSFEHDNSYHYAKKAYEENKNPENWKLQRKKIDEADNKYVHDSWNDPDEPILGKLASTAVYLKNKAENVGILPTRLISGFGTQAENQEEDDDEPKDPCLKLRQLVKHQYSHEKRKAKKQLIKTQHGGLAPIVIAGLTALVGALGKKFGEDAYEFVKKKIQGKGHSIPYHKTRKEKIEFLKQLVNSLK